MPLPSEQQLLSLLTRLVGPPPRTNFPMVQPGSGLGGVGGSRSSGGRSTGGRSGSSGSLTGAGLSGLGVTDRQDLLKRLDAGEDPDRIAKMYGVDPNMLRQFARSKPVDAVKQAEQLIGGQDRAKKAQLGRDLLKATGSGVAAIEYGEAAGLSPEDFETPEAVDPTRLPVPQRTEWFTRVFGKAPASVQEKMFNYYFPETRDEQASLKDFLGEMQTQAEAIKWGDAQLADGVPLPEIQRKLKPFGVVYEPPEQRPQEEKPLDDLSAAQIAAYTKTATDEAAAEAYKTYVKNWKWEGDPKEDPGSADPFDSWERTFTPNRKQIEKRVLELANQDRNINKAFQASQEKERAQQKYENQLGQAAEVFGVGPNTPGASLMSLVPPEQMSSPADLLQQRYEQLQQDVQVKQQQGNITWGKGEEARQKSYEKAAEDFEAALAGTGEFAKREIPNRLKAARQLLNKMDQNRPKKRQPKYSEIVSSRVTPVPGVPGMVAVDDTGDGNVNVKPVAAKTPEVEAATAAAAQANAQTAAMKERNQFLLEIEKLKQADTQNAVERDDRKREQELKHREKQDELIIKKVSSEIKALLDANKQGAQTDLANRQQEQTERQSRIEEQKKFIEDAAPRAQAAQQKADSLMDQPEIKRAISMNPARGLAAANQLQQLLQEQAEHLRATGYGLELRHRDKLARIKELTRLLKQMQNPLGYHPYYNRDGSAKPNPESYAQ